MTKSSGSSRPAGEAAVDTHVLLWAAGEPERLSHGTHSLIEAEEHELVFSSTSVWEIAITRSLGRPIFAKGFLRDM